MASSGQLLDSPTEYSAASAYYPQATYYNAATSANLAACESVPFRNDSISYYPEGTTYYPKPPDSSQRTKDPPIVVSFNREVKKIAIRAPHSKTLIPEHMNANQEETSRAKNLDDGKAKRQERNSA